MRTTLLAVITLGAGAGLLAAARSSAPLDDATIVAIFDEANTADIETAGLAERTSKTKEIQAVAKRLIEDHTMARQQGRDLAKKLHVTPTAPKPDPYAADHAKAMAELKAKHGTEFDRAFLDHEIRYHQAVIEALQTTLLPAIKNAELKAFVTKVAPAFQSHLDLVKATKTQLKL